MSTNTLAAQRYPEILQEISDEGNYLHEQVFNVNERIVLERGCQSEVTSMEEKLMPGYKATKDGLNLMFGDSASQQFEAETLLVYHSRT